jgi:hypothetical protein
VLREVRIGADTISHLTLDRDKDATLSNALLPSLNSLTPIFNDKPRFSFSILVDMLMSKRKGRPKRRMEGLWVY